MLFGALLHHTGCQDGVSYTNSVKLFASMLYILERVNGWQTLGKIIRIIETEYRKYSLLKSQVHHKQFVCIVVPWFAKIPGNSCQS